LMTFDKSIIPAETLPALHAAGITLLANLKRYDHVTLHRLNRGGGYSTFQKDLRQDRSLIQECVKLMQTFPPDEAVLIYTFKLRQQGDLQIVKTLREALRNAGFDLNAVNANGEKRVNIETYGREASLNCYSHCSRVILLGTFHRNIANTTAIACGQKRDMATPLPSNLLQQLQLSEVVYTAQQALGRGTCRIMGANGYALPMKGYLIHPSDDIEKELSKVFPGAVWNAWTKRSMRVNKQEEGERKIIQFLESAEAFNIPRVLIRDLKADLELRGLSNDTFQRARTAALRKLHPRWTLEGRTLVNRKVA
jgi:hypothetical protein